MLHTDARYPVILSTDLKLPEDKQPRFIFQYLSGKRWEEISTISDQFDDVKTGGDMIRLAFKAIRVSLVGWENMIDPKTGKEIPFDPAQLDDMLIPREAIELMQAAVSQVPTNEDKKKLESQSPSDTESSAKNAADA